MVGANNATYMSFGMVSSVNPALIIVSLVKNNKNVKKDMECLKLVFVKKSVEMEKKSKLSNATMVTSRMEMDAAGFAKFSKVGSAEEMDSSLAYAIKWR